MKVVPRAWCATAAALLCTIVLFVPAARGGAPHPSPYPGRAPLEMDFVDYLLGMGFVLEGTLTPVTSGSAGAHLVAVKVNRVFTGSVHDSTIVMDGGSRSRTALGRRAIEWGIWPTREIPDVYVGNFALIADDGALVTSDAEVAGSSRVVLTVRHRPLTDRGTYRWLVKELERHDRESAPDWLFSGTGLAIVQVDSIGPRGLGVHPVRWIAGEPGRAPRAVRVVSREPGVSLLRRTELVIPTSPSFPDTLIAPHPIARYYELDRGWIPVLGVRPEDLDRVCRHDAAGMHIRRIRIPQREDSTGARR